MATQTLLLRPISHRPVSTTSSSLAPPPPSRQSFAIPQKQTAATAASHFSHSQQQQCLLRFHTNAVDGAVLGVEPDLQEDFHEDALYKTAGEDTQETDFKYGKYDGAHTWHKSDDNLELGEAWSKVIEEAGGPADDPGQATVSWLFLPALFSGLAFGIQPEFLFLGAVLFIFAFIGIEMKKPKKLSNFEYDPNFPGPGYKP